MPIKAAFTSTLQTQFRWMPFRYIMNATFLLGMQSTVRASTASLLGVCLLSLVGLSPLPIQVWAWKDQGFVAAALPPATLAPVEALQASDLEGNGSIERLALAAGVLTITQNGSIAWRSPQAWQVAQAAITDLNHDGRPEVTLLVWRPFAPWPIDRYLPHPGRIASFHDVNGQSCHIILIGWKGGAFREVWAGSALAEPVKAFQVVSQPGGKQLLLTLDSRYTTPRDGPAQALSAWEWNGFGFSLVARQTGTFSRAVAVIHPTSPFQFYVLSSRR